MESTLKTEILYRLKNDVIKSDLPPLLETLRKIQEDILDDKI